MKKRTLLLTALTLALAGIAAPTQTDAKIKSTKINGMPTYMRHSWYRGKDKIKITKHNIYFAKVGHKPTFITHFNTVVKTSGQYKLGTNYMPNVPADWSALIYRHGYLYTNDQMGHWFRYHHN